MLLFCYILFFSCVNSLKLEQTVIFSRHNIRVPLSEHLGDYTNKNIPKWSEKPGYLTEKGAKLEGYMAQYITKWLRDLKILPKTCPDEENVLIYANNKQRTIATAKAFVKSAFPNCNIHVKYENNMKIPDHTFNPVIHNDTEAFKDIVIKEVEENLEKINIGDAYEKLDSIIDLKTSKICANKGICDLVNDKNVVISEVNQEIKVEGPLHIGNSVVDNFIMSFYEGRPVEEIAWGQITDPSQWELLTKISKADQRVRFNVPIAVDDVVKPLLNYMKSLFYNKKVKFALLVGHDANLNCITDSLGFVPFALKNQYEPFPIGGKIVFQKWKDECGDKYLKVEYFYLSWDQIRDGAEINSQNPLLRQILEINGCAIDENGLCPWSDFLKLLEKY